MKGLKVLIFILIFGAMAYGAWFGVQASKCPDSDLDNLNDCVETDIYHTEMFNKDTDGDGYEDGLEVEQGYSPHYGDGLKLNEVDSDRDGLLDSIEIESETNLNNKDTDGDGINDFMESKAGSNPIDETSVAPRPGFFKSLFDNDESQSK